MNYRSIKPYKRFKMYTHTHTHTRKRKKRKKKRVSNWTVRKFFCLLLQHPVTKSVFVFRFYTTYF